MVITHCHMLSPLIGLGQPPTQQMSGEGRKCARLCKRKKSFLSEKCSENKTKTAPKSKERQKNPKLLEISSHPPPNLRSQLSADAQWWTRDIRAPQDAAPSHPLPKGRRHCPPFDTLSSLVTHRKATKKREE